VSRADACLRRVGLAWTLLFVDVLGNPAGGVLHVPHIVGQLLTQGSLAVALVLVLTINPRVRVRPNLFLALYTLLGITSLMMSVRFVSLGTDYRAVRLLMFLGALWLLTPWWGRPDLVILRSQVRFLVAIVVTVVLGLVVAPGLAFSGHRLADVIWQVPTTQVAHYSAELMGISLVLWLGGVMRHRLALALSAPSCAVLVLTHTRTALVAALVGLAVAGSSLFSCSRRARRTFAAVVVGAVLLGVPASPAIASWMARGETNSQVADLTGRTNFWRLVLSENRPGTNKILGSGLSNGSVIGVGLPIDSSWLEVYQDQGILGDALVGAMFLLLLVTAASRPRGPRRALALFLVVYCVIASFTEDGAGIASQYALDMVVAASLLTPLSVGRSARGGAKGGEVPIDLDWAGASTSS
jgi:hypothetical protein